jgi:hypothetical protein
VVLGESVAHVFGVVRAPLARRSQRYERDLIVFVSNKPRAREQKFARALRRAGKRVVLLYRKTPNYALETTFDQYFQFSKASEALAIASSLRPLVHHVFTSGAVDSIAMTFVRNKPGPVIYDPTSIHPGLWPGHTTREKELQQIEALRSADALCCRDLQYRAASRAGHVPRRSPLIWFPEYLDEIALADLPPNNARLKAVSIGDLELSYDGGSAITCFFGQLIELGLEVHIFPHFKFAGPMEKIDRSFAPLVALGERTGRLFMHATVPPHELVASLSQFDIGLGAGLCGLDCETQALIESSTSSRESDYLAAGLVIVGSSANRLKRFIGSRYGMWFDSENLFRPGALERLQAAVRDMDARNNVSRVKYGMAANIPRLIRFYEAVSNATRLRVNPRTYWPKITGQAGKLTGLG